MYNKNHDGLSKEWFGRVFLNPPYSHPLVDRFVTRMARHNNGIALVFSRFDTSLFHDIVFPTASAILFLRKRVRFYRPDGTQAASPGCGSVLIAWGDRNAKILHDCKLDGKFVSLSNTD